MWAQHSRVVERAVLADEVPRLHEHALREVGADNGRVLPARRKAPREEPTAAADVEEDATRRWLKVALRHCELRPRSASGM